MDKDNVVQLGGYKDRKPEVVWECSCGDQLFYILQASGGARCRTCNRVIWFAVGDSRNGVE